MIAQLAFAAMASPSAKPLSAVLRASSRAKFQESAAQSAMVSCFLLSFHWNCIGRKSKCVTLCVCVCVIDDCHLQCLYGRAVDSSGRELCECRKVPDEDFRDLQVTIQTKVIDRAEGVDGQEADGDFVTAGANEAINCPRVPCKRMCAHGFQTDERGCPICKCQRCKSIQPCHKKCALGLVHDGRGCPTCHCRPGVSSSTSPSQNGGATRQPVMTSSFSVSSSSNGKCLAGGSNLTFYNYGDRWQMDDCTHCVCHPGGPTCTEMACPLPCHNAIFVPVSRPVLIFDDSPHQKFGLPRVTKSTLTLNKTQGQCCPVCGDGSRTSTIPTGGSSTGQQRNSDESRGIHICALSHNTYYY